MLEELGVESGWWRQTIASGHEVERGMGEVSETAEAGFQIGVQRTLAVGQKALWELLLSADGRGLWLGEVDPFDAEPETPYETVDGTTGGVRTVEAGERLRTTWQPAGRDEPTTLQLTLSWPRNDASKTTLRVHHGRLADAGEREAMRAHWRDVLDRIEASVAGGRGGRLGRPVRAAVHDGHTSASNSSARAVKRSRTAATESARSS